MNLTTRILATLCLLALPLSLSAQIKEIEFPRIRGFDGGAIQIHSAGPNGRSVQVSVQDGVKTIKASEGDEKVVITEDPDNGITVKWTRRYGPEDADQLEKTMPGLYMHLKSMPKKVDDAKVDVHVDVTKEYEADDKADLENKHPEVFKVYKKYTENQGGIRFGGALPMRLEVMPRVIDPVDFRKELDKVREEMKKRIKEMKLDLPKVDGGSEIIPDKTKGADNKKDEKVKEKKDEKKEDKKEEKKSSKRNDG